MKKEVEVIHHIKDQLQKRLHIQDGFEVIPELRWGSTSMMIVFDLVVRRNGKIIAVFEIKKDRESIAAFMPRMLNYVLSKTTAYLLIFYSIADDEFTICSRLTEQDMYNQSLDSVIKKIEEVSLTIVVESKKDEGVHDDKLLRFYENTEKLLDPEWCRTQLGKMQYKEICRYSSLDSLFSTLKFKTLRMNGLPGMNDKGEGLFAWNLIYKADETNNEEYKRRKRDINNAYIVSFSSQDKIDDLTQWRLYGDDAKGVCCIYSVQDEKIKDRFFLHKVRYIQNPQDNEAVSDELLKRFKKHIKLQSDLNYSDLSPAIFFYKPDSYKTEDEIRLLVDNKKTTAYKTQEYKREWLLTNSNNIPNPYIDVPLDDIPLSLDRILLGPNMNDVDTIQVQLEAMLDQQGIDATVELSTIKSYRNRRNY